MIQGEHSAIFSTFFKLPFIIKIFVLFCRFRVAVLYRFTITDLSTVSNSNAAFSYYHSFDILMYLLKLIFEIWRLKDDIIKCFDSFYNKNGCIVSCPIDFVVYNSCKIVSSSVTRISIVPKSLSKFKSFTLACVGILDTFSWVNRPPKHLFSSFAFSMSDCV